MATTESRLMTETELAHAARDLALVLAGPNPGSVKLWASHYGQRLIDAASALRWRPIDTARSAGVMDGRWLLLATADGVGKGAWSEGDPDDDVEYPARWEDVGGFTLKPTHWMPLPASPSTGA